MAGQAWQFWIDVGGTFTDCIGVAPDGKLHEFKTLSSGATRGQIETANAANFKDPARSADPPAFWLGAACHLFAEDGSHLAESVVTKFDSDAGAFALASVDGLANATRYELHPGLPAPVLAIRWLLRLRADESCPFVRVRFGTTRGTNALLTRTGARTALITTKGFGDVPLIGNQDRPHLFDLNIRKPASLFSQVFEVEERVSADGTVLEQLNIDDQCRAMQKAGLTTDQFDSVAICLMNAFINHDHETELEQAMRRIGFKEVSRSSEVSPQIRIVPRGDTTVLDAYLNPVLRAYLQEIGDLLPKSDIQVMTSVGGLVNNQQFRGRDCILSGPAGGIVGFARVAEEEGFPAAIGFDMGGTSTDVARFDGHFEYQNESTKAGVRVLTPVLAIETVAAGGGSICGFDGTRLFVGPQSAGAAPGPACYGAGGPLTVTDLNVFLGRILPQYFPFPLDTEAVRLRLDALRTEMTTAGATGNDMRLENLAEGLLEIANDNMAQAIRKVSVSQGYHPQDYVLVSFGGAGGQHASNVASRLDMQQILIHPQAGILSAYGMGQADVRAMRQVSVLHTLRESSLSELQALRSDLTSQTRTEVLQQVMTESQVQPSTMTLELRYAGTDSALMISEQPDQGFRELFDAEHQRQFGFHRPDREVEIAAIRIETIGSAATNAPTQPQDKERDAPLINETDVWLGGERIVASVIRRSQLRTGQSISGPAIICEPTSTIFIEPQCTATVQPSGAILIDTDRQTPPTNVASAEAVDPVMLEVFNNQFVSIAEQMGETLRRTSTSTNVRERLDFSCALFDADGQLVVNAPHVPVHLGAMGETVRAIIADHSDMQSGDVFVTNDPFRGGSHLPDVTVVTPVFVTPQEQRPAFYVANRAHHAEIGGIVPGSMPPFSSNLGEEGVLISSRRLIARGRSREDEIRQILTSGPWPSRAVDDNIADLAAQTAANACGAELLEQLSQTHSADVVLAYMKHIQAMAARKMRLCLQELGDRRYEHSDQLDDGTQICVTIRVSGDAATVDFAGTSETHAGNLNANRAITTAAVLYAFRCLLNEDVPLNAGVLEPVKIVIPNGLLNPVGSDTPETSPAIVGGNVETSQRIVDVLLGALGLAAASQGTMNNLTFGNESFGYYETICGGSGATPHQSGADAVHTHMTNTRLTDPEVLENRYPVRLRHFGIRRNSGGAGHHCGGNGIIRELEFLAPLQVSMLSQRRTLQPPGLNQGHSGQAGKNTMTHGKVTKDVGGCFSTTTKAGDRLTIETPGGGGCGKPT